MEWRQKLRFSTSEWREISRMYSKKTVMGHKTNVFIESMIFSIH